MTNLLSLIAVIASFTAIIYTRKNLQAKIYIDTITSQRVKWIGMLRQHLSDVISDTISLCYYEVSVENVNDYIEHVDYNDEIRDLRDEHVKLREQMKREISISSILKKIHMSILMLNQDDDNTIISQLDDLQDNILKGQYRSCIEEDFILRFRNECAYVLKREWEKVKSEVHEGSMINTTR